MNAKKESPHSREAVAPSAALQRIGKILLGTWKLTVGAEGKIRHEWAEGGFFLVQHVDLTVGRKIKGIEIIGHLQWVGESPSEDIWTRFYSFYDGLTLDYAYELDGKTLLIWFMKKGSDNRYKGEFSKDGNSFKGARGWPGGGTSVCPLFGNYG
jgi:hypothetical protein